MNSSLPRIFGSLHRRIERELSSAREALKHSRAGYASEQMWRELFATYLPKRYQVAKGYVVDSAGMMSDEIDVLVFDRQYSPLMFELHGATIVPAESVYAVFEAKQSLHAELLGYAQNKIASVRRLHRTSLPIPTANGLAPAKKPNRIIGGYLSLESRWKPPLGEALEKCLRGAEPLDLGCIAAHGVFMRDADTGCYRITKTDKAATMLLLELIARLQASATVPMIDVRAYSRWL